MRRSIPSAVMAIMATLALIPGFLRSQSIGGASIRAIGAIQPRVAPDGQSIAVSYQGAIWSLPSSGGTLRRLTSNVGFDSNPAWSADGKRIAFFNARELRVIDAATGRANPQPSGLQGNGELYFHPDGKRLLGNVGQPSTLTWVDLDSGALEQVFQPARSMSVFALSPDGSQIAFVTTQDVAGEQTGRHGPQADVWTMASSGGDAKKLVQFRSRIFDLWWGLNGLTIASDFGGAHNDLWTLPVDNSSPARRITSGQADEDGASTSADGRWMVYTDNREGATSLVRREVQTGVEQVLAISKLDFGAPTGTLKLRVLEKNTGAAQTARVSVQQKDGKYVAPPGALYWMLGNNVEHFYAAETADLTVPAGSYVVRAVRGMEYREVRVEVDVAAGREVAAPVNLERWTDPPSRGWWGGESHIHANYGYGQWYNTPATIRLQVEGEGLNLANMVVANSDTDGIFDREFFRGEPDPVSTPHHVVYWNEEFRATLWGHMTLLNLKRLVEPIMTGFQDTTNPFDVPTNADVADYVHLQNGHVNYTHPAPNVRDPFLAAYAARALPVDVALGKIDSLDINGAYDGTVPLWYRLLNCGFRLPASAGTDVFLNRLRGRLPGGDRAYVRLDGAFSYDAWVKGLKAGRSFVTNGPTIEFTANGKVLGETIALSGPTDVRVQASGEAVAALSRIEIVNNGVVVASRAAESSALSVRLDQTVQIQKTGWLGARVYGTNGAQAHTSPIYVDVSGRPTSSADDAAYFLEWIDRLEERFSKGDRVPSPQTRAHVKEQLDRARAVYRK
jgi:Tol biopolymer transport system component